MPRRRASSPDQIKQDFLDAIDRIRSGRPQHQVLRDKIKRGAAVSINFSTVALEAGRSRGLIAKEDCKYPEVRQLVLIESGASTSISQTRDDVIRKLRHEVAELRSLLSQTKAHAAFHFAKRIEAEKVRDDYRKRYERLKEISKRDGKNLDENIITIVPKKKHKHITS